MEWQTAVGEKSITKHICDKDFVSRIHIYRTRTTQIDKNSKRGGNKRFKRHFNKANTQMANKRMKKKLNLIIYETDNSKDWQYQVCQGCGVPAAHPLLLGIQNCTATSKSTLAVSYKVKPTCTPWSSKPTPRQMKTYVYTDICIQMFIANLLTIEKKTGKPQMSINWWMNKNLWYIHLIKTNKNEYSSIKMNKLLRHAIT